MLQSDLVKCSSCQSILDVLCSIDEYLAHIGQNHYYNDAFGTNLHYPRSIIKTILQYKRILTSKMFNPSYTDYTQSQLISRIKVLINV